MAAKRGMQTLPAGDPEDLAYVERSKALQRNVIHYLKTPRLYDGECTISCDIPFIILAMGKHVF